MARFKNLRRRNFRQQLQGHSGPVQVVDRKEPTEIPPPAYYRIPRKLPRNFPVRKDLPRGGRL